MFVFFFLLTCWKIKWEQCMFPDYRLDTWRSEVKYVLSSVASSANWQIFLIEGKECIDYHWIQTRWGESELRRREEAQRVPEQSEAGGAPLKLSGLLVTALNDLFWQVGQSSSVEAVALGTGTRDELVEERYSLLTRILTFILHHTSLRGAQRSIYVS